MVTILGYRPILLGVTHNVFSTRQNSLINQDMASQKMREQGSGAALPDWKAQRRRMGSQLWPPS